MESPVDGRLRFLKDSKISKLSTKDKAEPTSGSLFNDWRNKLKDAKYFKMNQLADMTFGLLVEYYNMYAKKHDGGRESCDAGMRDFFVAQGYADDARMDRCVRWSVLLKALETKQDDPDDNAAADAIINIVVEIDPLLAFENLLKKPCRNDPVHKITKDALPLHLLIRLGAHEIIKKTISEAEAIAVHSVAESREGPASQVPKKSLLELARAANESDRSVLQLSLYAKKAPIPTLKALLGVKGITDEDNCFNSALEMGLDKAVDILLDQQKMDGAQLKRFIIRALDLLDKDINDAIWPGGEGRVRSTEAKECRLNIVKKLVKKATEVGTFDQEVVESIIKKDLKDVWEEKNKDVLDPGVKDYLLHLAVFHEKVHFIQVFLDEYPTSLSQQKGLLVEGVQQDDKNKFPLWYNNHKWIGKDFVPSKREPGTRNGQLRTQIRDMIVTKMIHEMEMNDLSDILHSSLEPFNDMCFDISRINWSTYQVSDFVDSLIRQDKIEDGRMHRYEKTLKYVEFPPLDAMTVGREVYRENCYLQKGHNEVFRILKWLAGKGVTKIIKLKVPDRLINPHDELKMAKYVEQFKIEVLDWKVLDLPISIFSRLDHEIKELSLYSSGNRAVICHWFSEQGIASLQKETCTEAQIKELCREIPLAIEHLKRNKSKVMNQAKGFNKISEEFTAFELLKIAWYPTPSPADLTKIASRLAPRLAEWLKKLEQYMSRRKREQKLEHEPTRVAILDNGVLGISHLTTDTVESGVDGKDSTPEVNQSNETLSSSPGHTDAPDVAGSKKDSKSTATGSKNDSQETPKRLSENKDDNTLWTRIKAGRSFVDSNTNFCPWQFPSDPHGTQMANLICAIDPFCEIYVARVAEDASGITPKAVAKAIEWAISQDVDIISMSFVLGDKDPLLETQLENATKAGILMTCSTHDEGSRITKAYPASYKTDSRYELIVLAGCDEYGKLLRDIDGSEYDYKLCSKNVPAGIVPFVKSVETISGSSVATALAAGLCSLILTCDRLAHPGRKYYKKEEQAAGRLSGKTDRVTLVTDLLKRMQARPDGATKHVLLDCFGGISGPNVLHETPKNGQISFGTDGVPEVEAILKDAFKMVN